MGIMLRGGKENSDREACVWGRDANSKYWELVCRQVAGGEWGMYGDSITDAKSQRPVM